MTKLLILGGTNEAKKIAAHCADLSIEAIYSYAGRTDAPEAVPIPTRIGGFGGAHGLAQYLNEGGFTHLVDATHPFAEKISANAIQAAKRAGLAHSRFVRPPWKARPEDQWIEVNNLDEATHALESGRYQRALIATGRQSLRHFLPHPSLAFFARVIDKNSEDIARYPHIHLIHDRGPFDLDAEMALFEQYGFDVIISKNAGGSGAYAKIKAAAQLGIPVIMIRRPKTAQGGAVFTDMGAFMLHLSDLGA